MRTLNDHIMSQRQIKLQRITNTLDGMFGVIMGEDNVPFGLSLEKPWRFNKRNVSCIPTGTYNCVPHHSPDHPGWGMIYALKDVPGRSGIWIHPANLESDLRGCIAPGMAFDKIRGKDGVTSSKAALKELRALVDDESFTLQIVGPI